MTLGNAACGRGVTAWRRGGWGMGGIGSLVAAGADFSPSFDHNHFIGESTDSILGMEAEAGAATGAGALAGTLVTFEVATGA